MRTFSISGNTWLPSFMGVSPARLDAGVMDAGVFSACDIRFLEGWSWAVSSKTLQAYQFQEKVSLISRDTKTSPIPSSYRL